MEQAVAYKIASLGARVDYQRDYEAVMVVGKPINHILHLLLSVFTLGLWLIVWLILGIVGGEKREVLRVDEYGAVVQSSR